MEHMWHPLPSTRSNIWKHGMVIYRKKDFAADIQMQLEIQMALYMDYSFK